MTDAEPMLHAGTTHAVCGLLGQHMVSTGLAYGIYGCCRHNVWKGGGEVK